MICSCQTISEASSSWLVTKLKTLFQHHHQDAELMDKVVQHMPSELIYNRTINTVQLIHFIAAIFYFVRHKENHLDDMLMALNSLLRIAIKKSYTSNLTAKIVRCVGLIAQRCPDIYLLENFAVICKSTAKFITMPTLEVRFATLFTFTILLESNCVTSDAIGHSRTHWDFCQELYESIEFKKLTVSIRKSGCLAIL